MAKKWRRVTLSFDREHDVAITKLRKAILPFAPESIGLREILMQIANGCGNALQSVAESHGYRLVPLDQWEATSCAGAKEEKKKEEKKKKKEPRLAPLDLSQRILDDLNKRAGSRFQARGKVARQNIAARLAEGYTEADFYEVHRKMCAAWLETDMAQHLNYETLYGNKFAKYLGQPEPSKKPTQTSLLNGNGAPAGGKASDWIRQVPDAEDVHRKQQEAFEADLRRRERDGS